MDKKKSIITMDNQHSAILCLTIVYTLCSDTVASCQRGPVTCDFEAGLCGFQLSGHWNWTAGPFSNHNNFNLQTIPSTHNGVGYLVVHWEQYGKWSANVVTSPCMESGMYSLDFWYFCTGQDVGLTVRTSVGHTLINNHRDPERKWKKLSVTLQEKQQFKIIFQIVPSGPQYVGIDDIAISATVLHTNEEVGK